MLETLKRPLTTPRPFVAERPYPLPRIFSIDVFRAITMFLMIFVNDLDPIKGVPEWLKHAGEYSDKLGFADTIFPAFLFIVGLSVPFAIKNRLSKGDTPLEIAGHIGYRALALIVMGVLQVNLENYSAAALIPRPFWEIGITLGFFALWLDYPKQVKPSLRILLQCGGLALLVTLALLFKGGNAAHPVWLTTDWWGILGLIGWSYLICAAIFFLSKGRLWMQIAAVCLFLAFNIADRIGWLDNFDGVSAIVGNGAMPALTMGGVVVSMLYRRWSGSSAWIWRFLLIGTGLVCVGLLLRPIGGISKIDNTPSWVNICMGISIGAFTLLAALVDNRKKQDWFHVLRPAGTSTLTAYLLPYLLYSFFEWGHIHYPDVLNTGAGGFCRSLAVALCIVFVTGWLEKKHVKIRV